MGWYALAPEVRWTLVGVFALLVAASAVVWVMGRRNPEGTRELRQRVYAWWLLAAIFAGAMLHGRKVSIALFAFVSFLALKEYLSLIPTRRADHRPLFWAYLAIPLQYYWVYREWYGLFIIFIPVYCFLFIPARMLTVGQTEGYVRSAGTIHWGLMTTAYCLSHAAFLMILRRRDETGYSPGPGLMLFLIVLTELNDVFQYVWGKMLGRDKIMPAVSPNKTWQGFLGGVGTTTALALALGWLLTPMNEWQSIVAGLIISVGGFFGDVNMSALKRDLGMKDFGSLIPGHGGILDRVDSLTYTAPLFFHYTYFLFDWHTFGSAGSLL
jgi:phosphatidate cytidylyltransferase